MVLNNEEMVGICGGSVSFKVAALVTGIVAAIGVFLVGVWDGYLNPNACRK